MKEEDGCCGVPMSVDVLASGENSKNGIDLGGVSPESGEKTRKERRVSTSAKKPPRPPRGLSLDAADQKLIKEISELLMIKRARIERMKALKKTKAAKGTSASASSSGNLVAMLFTVLFCIVIIFQGCHPWGFFPRSGSAVGIPISPKSDGATEGGVLSLQDKRNLSTGSVNVMLSEVGSPNVLVAGSDNNKGGEGGRGAIR
ncbi:transmembrane protein [Perilla frutescens var. hirtella]|uniref:Transmembrane protein n=1 Tax=Perilla frutescens var. hirtella TaxID=608512 RepID=A0AAD4PB91_PERFH|nr:transmembrane protein [Perilla frutescens var. hirtella]